MLTNKIGISVYKYIYLIYFKKSMTDFQKFFLMYETCACQACWHALACWHATLRTACCANNECNLKKNVIKILQK